MAIIYIDKVKCYSDISGKNDNEIIDIIRRRFEIGGTSLNEAIVNGVIVYQYDAIIVEIKKQIENYIKINKKNFSYSNIPADEYWNLKKNCDFMVFMLADNITLPFDYFLCREDNGGVDEYYGYNNTNEVFKVLFKPECPSLDLHDHENVFKILRNEFKWFKAHRPGTPNNVSLKENLKVSEGLNQKWEMSDKKDVSIKDARSENREQRKSLLNGNRNQIEGMLKKIAKKIKQVFLIDMDKISENELYDYYKLLILIYYFESLGIKKRMKPNAKYERINIFDILSKPSVQLTLNWFVQDNNATKPESAYDLELFRCEIIKHLEIEQIRKINEKVQNITKCENNLFDYIAILIIFSSSEHVLEKLQFDRIKQAICEYKNPINENKEKYDFSIWEQVYFRYKMFCLQCEKVTSKDSLNRVLNLENPACIEKSTLPRLIQEIQRQYPYLDLDYEVPDCEISNLSLFLENNNNFWDNIFPNLDKEKKTLKNYGHYWVKDNIDTIKNVIKIMRKFKNINMSTPYSLFEVVSEIQALYEIKTRRIDCYVVYRGYTGNSTIRLIGLTTDHDYFGDNNGLPKKRSDLQMSYMEQAAFEYNWVAFIKRWYSYNTRKYDLSICSFHLEIALFDLIMEKIQKIDDVDSFWNFMNNDLHLCDLELYSRQIKELDNQLNKDGYKYHLSIKNSDLLIEISHLFGWEYLIYYILRFSEEPINFKLLQSGTPYEVYMQKDEVNRILHIDAVNIFDIQHHHFQS